MTGMVNDGKPGPLFSSKFGWILTYGTTTNLCMADKFPDLSLQK